MLSLLQLGCTGALGDEGVQGAVQLGHDLPASEWADDGHGRPIDDLVHVGVRCRRLPR